MPPAEVSGPCGPGGAQERPRALCWWRWVPPALSLVGRWWSHPPQWTLSKHKAHSGASPAPGMWEADEMDRSPNLQRQIL